MTTEDFEKAIEELWGPLTIDEMVLGKGGQVKCVYGHTMYFWIRWDSLGYCFAVPSNVMFRINEPLEGHRDIEDTRWHRASFYDLKFDNVMKKENKTTAPTKEPMTDEEIHEILEDSIDGWNIISIAIKMMLLGKVTQEREKNGDVSNKEVVASVCVLCKMVADLILLITDDEDKRQELRDDFVKGIDMWLKDDDEVEIEEES